LTKYLAQALASGVVAEGRGGNKKINAAYEQLKSYQPGSPNQTSPTGIYSPNSFNAEDV